MPIRIKNGLPVKEKLERENLFVIDEKRAIDEPLVKEFQYALATGTYDERRFLRGERPGEYKKGDYVTGLHEVGAPPDDVAAEMNELVTFIGKKNSKRVGPLEAVGTSLKSVHDWNACDTTDAECAVGTNRYGFNARPAGRRNADGTYDDLRRDAGFWIAEESDNASHARYWDLYYATDKFWGDYTNSKSVGYSVRCLKD